MCRRWRCRVGELAQLMKDEPMMGKRWMCVVDFLTGLNPGDSYC